MKHRFLTIVAALLVLAPSAASSADEPVFVDPDTARWQVEHIDASLSTFYFGLPGDVPLAGDWDCDGIDSAGMWRPETGFMYLQDDATGVAKERLFIGHDLRLIVAESFERRLNLQREVGRRLTRLDVLVTATPALLDSSLADPKLILVGDEVRGDAPDK